MLRTHLCCRALLWTTSGPCLLTTWFHYLRVLPSPCTRVPPSAHAYSIHSSRPTTCAEFSTSSVQQAPCAALNNPARHDTHWVLTAFTVSLSPTTQHAGNHRPSRMITSIHSTCTHSRIRVDPVVSSCDDHRHRALLQRHGLLRRGSVGADTHMLPLQLRTHPMGARTN